MTYIFLDTNIFLHFKDFEQINWNEVIETNETITIALAPTVIDELDKHKYNSNKKIQKRAKKLLPRIETFIEDPSQCRYHIIFLEAKPSEETFSVHQLDKREQDDAILASVTEFLQSHPKDNIVYITHDVGPRLKAKRLGVTTCKLSEDYLLPSEPDESEKEKIALQKELSILKNKIPDVKILFDTETDLMVVKQRPSQKSEKEFIQKQMDQIKEEHPRLVYYPPDKENSNTLFQIALSSGFSLSEDQVNHYNKELEKFYEKYEQFADSLYSLYLFKDNSIEIKLIIKNSGTTPAHDIDIHFHFPDGFELCGKGGLPKIMKKPEPPYKPKHRFDHNFSFGTSLLNPILPDPVRNLQNINFKPNVSKPDIKKTNSYNVDFHVSNVKHNQAEMLTTLYATFENINQAKGFSFDYKIMAANIPQLVTGKLHVKFESTK